jgi:hypothetical protein
MRTAILVFAFTLTIGSSALAEMTTPTVSLAKARLVKVDDIWSEPGSPKICASGEPVCFDGSWRLSFKIVHLITGPAVEGPVTVDQASSQPILGRNYLVVISNAGGANKVEWNGSLKNGLCAAVEDIARWRLESVASRYPCRN